jgi:hypothetical protein
MDSLATVLYSTRVRLARCFAHWWESVAAGAVRSWLLANGILPVRAARLLQLTRWVDTVRLHGTVPLDAEGLYLPIPAWNCFLAQKNVLEARGLCSLPYD